MRGGRTLQISVDHLANLANILMHQTYLTFFVLWPMLHVSCIQIPRIDNASLVPITLTNFTTILNSTCYQCICLALANHSAALNCFPNNNTCQLFDQVPIRHRLQSGAQAKLYFPSGSLPNGSQCCMPDLNVLLAKLSGSTLINVNQSSPRCLAVDDHGYLATVRSGANVIRRFNLSSSTFVNQTNLSHGKTMSIAFHGNAYYIGSDNNTIEMVNSDTLSTVNVITHSYINGVRDIIFLRDGQMMVVASTNNQSLVFFNRSNAGPLNYTFAYKVSTSYPAPHGLWYVNDSFFYATSWNGNSVYSHTTTDGVTWNETLFANVNTVVSGAGAAHVMIDECGRRWVSRASDMMIIYDSAGNHIGNFTLPLVGIFDALFLDNYVLHIADKWGGRIIRLDPHVRC